MEGAVKCNVVSAGYHGEVFEGPASRKLLKNSDYLLSGEFLAGVTNPISIIPITITLQAFNKLVEACFGCCFIVREVYWILWHVYTIEGTSDNGGRSFGDT